MDASSFGDAAPSLAPRTSRGTWSPSSDDERSRPSKRSARARVLWLKIHGGTPAKTASLEEVLTEESVEALPLDIRTDHAAGRLQERPIRWKSTPRALSANVDGHPVRIRSKGTQVGFSCACGGATDIPCAHAVALARTW